MEKKQVVCEYKIYDSIIELPEEYRQVLEAAISAADSSYSPYSGFSVGAAIKLDNGVIVKGSNQENAAYPSGLCAERTAMFYASATYPGVPMLILAIAAKKNGKLTKEITFPCGSCRQVMKEFQTRGGKPMAVIIGSASKVFAVDSADALLPFAFDNLDE